MNADNKFVTCRCHSCSGGIEFKRDLFDPENPAVIQCPHCGSETHLYIPNTDITSHIPAEETATQIAEKQARVIRDAKMYLKDAWNERLWFWQDTFRSPDQMEGAGTNEQPTKLYFAYGYRFKMPSEDNIRAILEALDAYSPTWDKDRPEYFFSTLEQNFPQYLKQTIDFEELEILREIYANPSQDSV